MTVRSIWLVAVSMFACASPVRPADLVLFGGQVIDENAAPVPGARVSLRSITSLHVEAITDITGAFQLRIPPGEYAVTADCAGFYALGPRPVAVRNPPDELQLTLAHVRELSESVDVTASAAPVGLEDTSSQRRLTGTQILNTPYPATRNFRNALRLMPGVVQDNKGALHFDGGLENQVFYSLDGFNIGDPITGRFNVRVSVDAVRGLEWTAGRYSPEFGKGSAGAMNVVTSTGDDRMRVSATNFVPGVDTRSGLHIGTWAPRIGFSGPIRRGRAWLSDSTEAEFSQKVVPETGQRTTSLRGSNLLRLQTNLTPSNILSLNLLGSYENAPHSGLSALDPLSTTIDRRGHQWFVALKDQMYLGSGRLFEIGYARNRTRFGDQPQGTAPYIITPEGRAGNYFVASTQEGARDQLITKLYLSPFRFAGVHEVQTGIDLDRVEYRQDAVRTVYEFRSVAGALLQRTSFAGPRALRLQSKEASSYIVDTWRLPGSLTLEYGLRQDWDRLVGKVLFSPRLAAAYSPAWLHKVRLAAGYAVVYDASQLAMFARSVDQHSITYSAASGETWVMSFRVPGDGLEAPRYRNISFAAARELPWRMQLTANFLRRRGENGFTYLPDALASVPGSAVFSLTNHRLDQNDSASIGVHKAFGRGYEVMANYVRSRAVSNAVFDLGVDQPLRINQNFGPVSWDAPHRVLSWGYLPGWNRNWAIAYLLDLRSGFPFSLQTETGEVVGAVNSHRYPTNFDLNLHLERQLVLMHYRLAVRGGFNNITNHTNPTGVNNTIGSPHFLKWYGSEGRHLVFRVRFLGRE